MSACYAERLVVYGKEPSPGRVKTRLSPPLSQVQAAALARAFLLDTLNLARSVDGVEVVLAFTPPSARRAFEALSRESAGAPAAVRAFTRTAARSSGVRSPLRLAEQRGADLGARMANTFARAFAEGARRVVIIGSDSPSLPSDYVRAAFDALVSHDLVLGPTTDGGYYLIGTRSATPTGWLKGVLWSSGREYRETVQKAEARGITAKELPQWYDVDTPDDLSRLCREIDGGDGTSVARHTAACLKTLSFCTELT
jgi:rSAM/selenodomain-associated transferase 1